MEAQSIQNNLNPPTATRQRKTSRLTTQHRCRLLRLSPLICVVLGAILTVVGHTASIKICKIAGPVVMTFGGLLLAFITLCLDVRCQDRSVFTGGTSLEQGVTTRESDERSDDQLPELGPIHHFEIWISSEPSSEEMVPPSYEDAVKNNDTESFQTNIAAANDDQEFNLKHETVPPLYEEIVINNNKESLQTNTGVVEVDKHGQT